MSVFYVLIFGDQRADGGRTNLRLYVWRLPSLSVCFSLGSWGRAGRHKPLPKPAELGVQNMEAFLRLGGLLLAFLDIYTTLQHYTHYMPCQTWNCVYATWPPEHRISAGLGNSARTKWCIAKLKISRPTTSVFASWTAKKTGSSRAK